MQKNINASIIFRDSSKGILKHILVLPGDEVSFGRDPENDVKLALFPLEETIFQWSTADISRNHFTIYKRDGNYLIKDMKSTNGTSLNCIAVLNKELPLFDNQIIDVGGVLDLKVEIRKDFAFIHRLTNTPQEFYVLFNEQITIGRTEENTIVLKAEGVYSKHATINFSNGAYFISKKHQNAIVKVDNIFLESDKKLQLPKESHIIIGKIELLFKIQERNKK